MPVLMRDDIPVERLRSLIEYDASTGVLYWKTTGRVAGSVSKRGYVNICIEKRFYRAHRVAFAVAHGRWPSGEVDHINRMKSDNRIDNLRECSKSENGRNRGLLSSNVSGFRGVFWDSSRKKWRAAITMNGERKMLGRFDSAREASECFLRAESEALARHQHDSSR